MALTAGNEIALYLEADNPLTYAQVETALTDAGFTSYVIVRGLSAGGTILQLTVMSDNQQPLDAADTLTQLAEAIAAIGVQSPA